MAALRPGVLDADVRSVERRMVTRRWNHGGLRPGHGAGYADQQRCRGPARPWIRQRGTRQLGGALLLGFGCWIVWSALPSPHAHPAIDFSARLSSNGRRISRPANAKTSNPYCRSPPTVVLARSCLLRPDRGCRRYGRRARPRALSRQGRPGRLLGVLVRALPPFLSMAQRHAGQVRRIADWSSSA